MSGSAYERGDDEDDEDRVANLRCSDFSSTTPIRARKRSGPALEDDPHAEEDRRDDVRCRRSSDGMKSSPVRTRNCATMGTPPCSRSTAADKADHREDEREGPPLLVAIEPRRDEEPELKEEEGLARMPG